MQDLQPLRGANALTTARSGLVEGSMSQTGANTRHSDADGASKAIEERLRLIIEAIPAIIWRKLPDGSADFLNQHFREYTGVSLEDGLGWGWMKAFHPDDRLMEEWRAALAAGKPFEKEARLRRADGQYRWFLIRAVPLRDEPGNIVNWYGTSIDIEDLKRAEDRVRLVINTIPTMVWTLQPDGAVDFVNQRWLDYTGLTLEEEIEDPTGPVHPEDLPRVMEKWLVDVAAGEPSEDEMRLRRADGEYRWFLVCTAPLRDGQGNVVKWYGVSIDIDDRKRAESQSWTLLDAIPQQIWSGPAHGTLDYCNERWRSYMGLGLEELQGHGWQSMLHPDDRDRVLRAWHESVTKGTPYEQEERHRRVDGTYRWFLARGLPLRDAEGRIVRWYGTNTDIEDRRRAEEELRRLSGQLLRLQDEERRRIARDLHDSTGQNLVALATSLARLQASIPTANRKSRKLLLESQSLADQCIREVRTLSYLLHPPMLEEAGLEDAIRLFVESLTNVRRHSGSLRAEIRINRGAKKVTLEVSDRGGGMPDIPLRRDGDSPFRIGVGIASMQERVKLIGGRLDIESGGSGTTVRVTIPVNE